MRELIYQYKFRNHRRLGLYFALWLARAYRTRYAGEPLVPVPFRPSGKRQRGWDHIECILDHLEHIYRIPVQPLLVRDNGRQQKRLDFEGRMGNLKGRVRMRGAATHPFAGGSLSRLPASVVLLDDIFTTGATASECGRVLREAGIDKVSVLTIAID